MRRVRGIVTCRIPALRYHPASPPYSMLPESLTHSRANTPKILSVNRESQGRPFEYEYIRDFEQAFLECFADWQPMQVPHVDRKRQVLRFFKYAYRALPRPLKFTIPPVAGDGMAFGVLCGGDFAYLMAPPLWARRRFVYMFDHWPRANGQLLDLQRLFGLTRIFFSAQQSAALFNDACGEEKGVWIPEGIQPDGYSAAPLADKTIDVLEFGRRFAPYHDKLRAGLGSSSFTHLYGPIDDLKKALSQAKISVCFPSALTHPERSEFISTMTLRYLQSMVSRCLVVGSVPKDMALLFDYVPIVEADLGDPAGQIRDILANYDRYLPLIERNYQEVMNRHLWRHRMAAIRKYIS